MVYPVVATVENVSTTRDAVMGHLAASINVLIPGPGSGQFTQASSFPLSHVNADIPLQGIHGDTEVVLFTLTVAELDVHAEGLLHVDAPLSNTLVQIDIEVRGRTEISLVQAVRQLEVDQATGHQHVINSLVAVGRVVIDIQDNLDIGMLGLEIVDQVLHAVVGSISANEMQLNGVLGQCNVTHSKQHDQCQQHCKQLFRHKESSFLFFGEIIAIILRLHPAVISDMIIIVFSILCNIRPK